MPITCVNPFIFHPEIRGDITFPLEMAGKLKRSASFIDDNDDSDEQPAPRTTKKTKGSTGSELKDDEGNPYWEVRCCAIDSTIYHIGG